jgi:hypothetical protein
MARWIRRGCSRRTSPARTSAAAGDVTYRDQAINRLPRGLKLIVSGRTASSRGPYEMDPYRRWRLRADGVPSAAVTADSDRPRIGLPSIEPAARSNLKLPASLA